MPDAIMLSAETFDRLKRLLDDWDNGLEKSLQVGLDLSVEERGTEYVKIGVNVNALLKTLLGNINPGGGGFSTIDLEVCVDGSPETHTFVIAD